MRDRAGPLHPARAEVQLLIDLLRLTLPARPPPKIHLTRLGANAPGVVKTFFVQIIDSKPAPLPFLLEFAKPG